MRQLAALTRIFCCVLMIALPQLAPAQDADETLCAPPNYPTDVRPEPHSAATEITIGMRVFDITEINDVNQTISIDIAYRMSWSDPRLADKAGCKLSTSNVWFPSIIVTNSGRMFHRWPDVVTVTDGGVVKYTQRMSGTFSGYQNLKDFPFDHQEIALRIVPLDWSSEKLVFVSDKRFTGINFPLNISDWSIRGVEAEVDAFFLDAVDQERSAYILTVSADRHASFYIWKVLMPITLIVIMSWCVFWINPSEFGTQLGLSASSVLTMVAFIFATTGMMPVLGYFTLMDGYIALSTVFVFLGLLQSLVSGYVASTGRLETAVRIDHMSRIFFPIAFLLVCYLLYFFSGVSIRSELGLAQ